MTIWTSFYHNTNYDKKLLRYIPNSIYSALVEKQTGEVTQVSNMLSMMAIAGFTHFQLEALQTHNDLRQKHGVPPLKLNRTMNALAQQWAESCIRNNTMSHRPNNNYGENIYWKGSSNVNQPYVKDAVQTWYAEIRDYTFGIENNSSNTFHFTQVVWKSSTELGVGMVSANGHTYVVANYNPPGNYMGSFVPNVPRPIY